MLHDPGHEPGDGHAFTSDDDLADVAVAASVVKIKRGKGIGIWLAPIGILALSLWLYSYYQGLDLENAIIQRRSSLDWDTKLWPQLQEQFWIAFWSTVLVVMIAIPLGVALTRTGVRRLGPWVLAVANGGQALPAYGLLILFLAFMGQGSSTVIWALTLFAILPVLRNTMVGLDNVDRNVIEAGRGMGMTKRQALTRIELPLAVPVIIAGVRIAMIINIGMATLAFLIGGGGLGITISVGLKLQQDPVLIVASSMVAIMALTFDWLGALAERYLRPKGL
jgi:osmoprotectant transport system permease protein